MSNIILFPIDDHNAALRFAFGEFLDRQEDPGKFIPLGDISSGLRPAWNIPFEGPEWNDCLRASRRELKKCGFIETKRGPWGGGRITSLGQEFLLNECCSERHARSSALREEYRRHFWPQRANRAA